MNSYDLPADRIAENHAMAMVPADGQPRGEPVPEDSFSPYHLIHQYLRGRYLLVIALGAILGTMLATAGWVFTKPLYRSDALIRISYDIPKLTPQNQDFRPMEVFEAFMQSQEAMITSHRVLSAALQEPIWNEQSIKVNPKAIDGFAGGLRVEHRGGTEHLKVTYESSSADFAAAAVQSVVNAYVKLYNSMDKQSATEKTAALDQRRDELVRKMEQIDEQLRIGSAEYGSSNVDKFYDSAIQRLTRIESALLDVRIALALTSGQRGGTVIFTPQQIARIDATMARYMNEREDLEMRVQQLRMRGLGEEHKDMAQTKKALEMVGNRIRDYAADFQDSHLGTPIPAPSGVGAPGVTGVNNGLVGRTAEELRADETNLVALDKQANAEMAAVGASKLKLEALRAELEKNKTELVDIAQKLAAMQLESGLSGRLSVMSNGEVPLLPFRDRRMHLAGAGALAGLALPAAGFVAVGMSRKRYRCSVDATDDLSKTIPLLGILPQLPARLTDPESAADAAQCLHQIRVMLQVRQPGHGPVAYLMTSACPGEGKTSLAAALALSFAASGARTLIVDGDMIGQRLTRGYRLDDKPGFREAMQYGAKNVAYYASGVERLSILPAGISDGRDACAVSSRSVRKLLSIARDKFDVVLVDSGPILGSLEALVLAQNADGVILTISREQQKPLVDRAIRQLHSVNAKIAGMVFNKAESADFRRSVGASSLRSIPRNPESSALMKAGVTSTSGFGSLVDSVKTYMPSAEHGM